MSTWTHITGIINCDSMALAIEMTQMDEIRKIIKECFGGIELYFDEDEMDQYLEDSLSRRILLEGLTGESPVSGSEGSWQYYPLRIDTKSSVNNIIIPFWGNLRDFGKDPEDLKKIVKVIKEGVKKMEERGIIVRGLCFLIESERGFSKLLYMKDSEEGIKVIDILG